MFKEHVELRILKSKVSGVVGIRFKGSTLPIFKMMQTALTFCNKHSISVTRYGGKPDSSSFSSGISFILLQEGVPTEFLESLRKELKGFYSELF